MSAPPTMIYRDVEAMYEYFLNHLISTFYFRVSHPHMTLDAQGDPPKPTHQEILKEEHGRANHVVDVLHACRRIMDLL